MNNILINKKNNTLRVGKEGIEFSFTTGKVKNVSIVNRSDNSGRVLYMQGNQRYGRDFTVVCDTITYDPQMRI